MFYLTHFTHLHRFGHMIKYHADNERKPATTTSWTTFSDKQQEVFYIDLLQTGLYIIRPTLHQMWMTDWKEQWCTKSMND